MNYKDFELIDFVLDESFQRWVLETNPQSDKFWQRWMEENPDKKEMINRAAAVLKSVDYKKSSLSETDKVNLMNDIKAKIKADELTTELEMHVDEVPDDDVDETVIYSLPLKKARGLYRIPVAAAILLLLAVAGYWMFSGSERVVYETAYGETEHIKLPDGSRLVLNANSTISYLSNWDSRDEREVILDGEAFFSIEHTPDHQRFIVHSNNVEVEVLGTEFNVNNRRGKSQVVLQSGKVKLNLKPVWEQRESDLENVLVMQPGDLVEVSDKDTKITKKIVNPEYYSSWTNDILTFDKMPLSEVFELIQDNYGYNVIVLEEGIEQRLFTAEISSRDLDFIIVFLSKSFNLEITKHNNELLVRKK